MVIRRASQQQAKPTLLQRRRGTSSVSSSLSSSSQSKLGWTIRLILMSLFLLLVMAVVALIAFISGMNSSPGGVGGGPGGGSSSSTAFRRQIPYVGVPYLLRGRSFADTPATAGKAPEVGDHLSAMDLNAMNGPPPPSKPIDNELYDEYPTKPYPYPLFLMDSNITDLGSHFTPLGGQRYTEYTSGGMPWLINPQIQLASDQVARSRRVYVKAAMQHAWKGYVDHAFGFDEILPISGRGSNNWGGQGMTMIDSLDTLWLMGMKDEFQQARDWIAINLDFNRAGTQSTFETTIRALGGLLSAYDWSGDVIFRDKALDLGRRLLGAFGDNDIPATRTDLKNGRPGGSDARVLLAEIGTLQIENRYLSHVTGHPEFARKTEHVFELLHAPEIWPPGGLFPYALSATGGRLRFANDVYTFGAMADSAYEYMLKVWIQGGRNEPMYRELYDKAMEGMHKQLEQKSSPSGLTYLADLHSNSYDHKMDHLACFMGGLLALGAYTDPQGLHSERASRDLRTGKALTYTCYQMYARMNTGISAEFVQFEGGKDFVIGRGAPHYLLRPEAVESFFILNKLTGDPVYREWGWEVFLAIEKYCKTSIAYGELSNVANANIKPRDKMESFFLAETLKYLYLLFDPETEVDILRKHVFNTEAHPMRVLPYVDAVTSS